MVAQAITFFTAGFETTSNLMGFVMYELSFRQDCQDKLRQEIIETFQNEESEITFDKIQQMQYLDMVIAGKSLNFILKYSLSMFITLTQLR